MAATSRTFTVPDSLADQTLAAVLRQLAAPLSWSEARRLIVNRHVRVGGALALNDARRLRPGELIELFDEPLAPVPREQSVRVLHVDPDLIVVDKPAGIVTLRRDEERDLSEEKRDLQPTLDELVPLLLPGHARPAPRRGARPKRNAPPPSVYAVHRLDRDTSGLMLFALSPRARDALIERFKRHEINRTYVAVVHGVLREPRTIVTWIVRDRGDGLRGSVPEGAKDGSAQRAVTHVKPMEVIGGRYSLAECRLETGRTHQIRVHLSEIGHMLCGEKLYVRAKAGSPVRDEPSGAPRQALHSGTLEFTHPASGRKLSFTSPLPADLGRWLEGLRGLR